MQAVADNLTKLQRSKRIKLLRALSRFRLHTVKPIAIFRHSPGEGAGYFAHFLNAHGIPWVLVRLDAGDTVPPDVSPYSGFCFMGGPMSVNDDLPWIPPALALIKQAVSWGIPTLGHCLGGQLISKALGGTVTSNDTKEIGWGNVAVTPSKDAEEWFGHSTHFTSFHWHGETFSLPRGAMHLLSSQWCANQAYVLDGRHLAMQCHVEMTEEMVRAWAAEGAPEIASSPGPGVQESATILDWMGNKLPALTAVASRLYSRWSERLPR